MTPDDATLPPVFDAAFQQRFEALLAWRRDVRRFRADPVPPELIAKLIHLADLSPSVGNSQPWRLVRVDDPTRRSSIIANFKASNSQAAATYDGVQAARYAALKLEGLETAPVHLAVFCDDATGQGHRLGRLTMPEMLRYSAVLAVHTFWLAARAHGLGAGWVSILDPAAVSAALDVPPAWHLIAYLCVGWPAEEHVDPELERLGWQERAGATVVQR